MQNVFASWICIDDAINASYFPSAKGSSADIRTQAIYWRCLAVCMYTARFYNPSVSLAVFSNSDHLPLIDGININDLFQRLKVKFYTTAFEFQTPHGYYKGWKNQFYEFSIFKFIADHPDFAKEDNFCLIDSDCVVTGVLDGMFEDIDKNKSISYRLSYNENHIINGNSRTDMKNIFSDLMGNKEITHVPSYYAGEYFGAKISFVSELMDKFYKVWNQLLLLHKKGLPHLHEEAHVLSFLYFALNVENSVANIYIKRIWTDPTTMRNVEKEDDQFLLWHLPAEKRFGFKEMFNFLKKYSFSTTTIRRTDLIKKLQSCFTIPSMSAYRKIFYFVKGGVKKLLQK